MKAIVVDDSRAARTLIRKALQERGFLVAEAEDGVQALERLREDGPANVALVDWNMPVMNGLDFVKAVRANRAYDEMSVMMVTSETEFRQLVRALNAGANEYLMKPFSKEALFQKLDLLGFHVDG